MYEITNRTAAPYRTVCYILTEWADGTFSRGSGVVVGVNDVLTANHVVYSAVHGGVARSITIYPGADTNPYLAYAAVLAAGLDGINNKIEAPEIFLGDVYQAQELPRVPYTLREATELFASSEFVKQAFGSEVQEHYTHFFETEQKAFDNSVTDWERWRYFERI